MAIAKPVRALGLAGIFMWCFYLYTVFWKPESGTASSADFHGTIPRDPNLDCTSTTAMGRPALCARANL